MCVKCEELEARLAQSEAEKERLKQALDIQKTGARELVKDTVALVDAFNELATRHSGPDWRESPDLARYAAVLSKLPPAPEKEPK